MRNLHIILVGLSLLVLVSCVIPLPGADAEPTHSTTNATYGQRVTYRPGQSIRFPDFTLTYVGMRHEQSALFPHGFTFHDFQIKRMTESYTVSWSSGTGVLGPAFFAIKGRAYRLELVYSDELSWLADNELVVWPEVRAVTAVPDGA